MRELQPYEQRFSVEEVGELIDLAARLDELATSDGLLYDDLLRVADEVGISPVAIEPAVVEDRASLKAVQLMLGHASAQITLDRYSHLYEDDLEDLADSMDARYGAAQVRPKPESRDIVDLDEKRKKAAVPTYSEKLGLRSSGDTAPVS